LQQGLRHLQTAFSNFFAGRAKYPNFKKKHNGGSAEFTKSAFKTIVVEDLAIINMLKNPKLALAISDASWAELVRQLEYKCDWYGRNFVKIDRWFPSSKRCGHCGYIVDKLPLTVREWDCPSCGTHHDRDINAAKNILAAGLAVSVCGVNIRPDRDTSKRQLRNPNDRKKQKPKS